MLNCSRQLRAFFPKAGVILALLWPLEKAVSQTSLATTGSDSHQQRLDEVERNLRSTRLQILQLRAEADYIESAISEEIHLLNALNPKVRTEIDDPGKDQQQETFVSDAFDRNNAVPSPPPEIPARAATYSTSITRTEPNWLLQTPARSLSEETVRHSEIEKPSATAAQRPSDGSVSKEEVLFAQRGVNLRSAPTLRSRTVGSAARGARFIALGRRAGWIEVKRGLASAWIIARSLGQKEPAARILSPSRRTRQIPPPQNSSLPPRSIFPGFLF
jgi:hypothetical protein